MAMFTRSRRRTAAACVGAGAVLLTSGLIGLGGQGAQASSHREAPLIAGIPQYDNTDTYAFRSPDRRKTVTLSASWLPFEEPAGGPNFYAFATDAHYDINVDNDGDARPDIIFRWEFEDHYRSGNTILYNTGAVSGLRDPDLNFYQTYKLWRINRQPGPSDGKVLLRNARVAPSFVGDASMPNYQRLRNQATVWTGKPGASGRSFAGQAEDSFFLDLRLFDLLYGGDLSEVGDDSLAGFNVNSVALQLKRRTLAHGRNVSGNPIIGVWSTTDRLGADGSYHQVSRLGNPLVNEVVIPLRDKDVFNASQPRDDAQFLDYVTDPEVPELIEAIYGDEAPPTPRDDLVEVFLTGVDGLNQPRNVVPSEQLRLNMTTPVTENPNRLGVIGGDNQGFPNGRRLTDDVLDIDLQVLEGELAGEPNDYGDGVNTNDVAFADSFPYFALPASGSDEDPHAADGAGVTLPSGGAVSDGGLSVPQEVPVLPIVAIALGLVAIAGGTVSWLRKPSAVTA